MIQYRSAIYHKSRSYPIITDRTPVLIPDFSSSKGGVTFHVPWVIDCTHSGYILPLSRQRLSDDEMKHPLYVDQGVIFRNKNRGATNRGRNTIPPRFVVERGCESEWSLSASVSARIPIAACNLLPTRVSYALFDSGR